MTPHADDFDYINMPYFKNGDVYDTTMLIGNDDIPLEDAEAILDYFYACADYINTIYDIDESGLLTRKGAEE